MSDGCVCLLHPTTSTSKLLDVVTCGYLLVFLLIICYTYLIVEGECFNSVRERHYCGLVPASQQGQPLCTHRCILPKDAKSGAVMEW